MNMMDQLLSAKIPESFTFTLTPSEAELLSEILSELSEHERFPRCLAGLRWERVHSLPGYKRRFPDDASDPPVFDVLTMKVHETLLRQCGFDLGA